jgi:hypothetical protein
VILLGREETYKSQNEKKMDQNIISFLRARNPKIVLPGLTSNGTPLNEKYTFYLLLQERKKNGIQSGLV